MGQLCVAGSCECALPGWVYDSLSSQCTQLNCPALTIANGTVSPSGNAIYNDVATYGCNTNFMLQGNGTRTCQIDGTWSGTDPTCVATAGPCVGITCGGHGSCSPVGNMGICACDSGWVGANCDMPVTCSGLVDPANGSVTPTTATVGNSATYTCSVGYVLNGQATTTCQLDGTWNNAAPTCDPVACPTIAAPTNGGVSATSGTYGNSITYSCNGGYAISGNASRTCQADGTWTGTDPTCVVANDCSANPCQNGATCTNNNPTGYTCACTAGWSGANCDVPADCGALSAPTNGTVSTSATTYQGTATYSCNTGYQLTGNGGSAMRTCQAAGTWSGTAPTCALVTCAAGNAPTNGSVTPAAPTYGSDAIYACNAGYNLNGASNRTCQADGTLSGVAPTCVPVSCSASNPLNGTVDTTMPIFGDIVSYACNTGFMIGSGNQQRTCQADGTLSGTAPTCVIVTTGCDSNPCVNGACTSTGPTTYTCACTSGWTGTNCDVPVDCGALASPNNGLVTTGATTLGNTASYSCNAGYALNGGASRTCQADGTWSGAVPSCDPITCSGLTAPTNGSLSATSTTYPNTVMYACNMGYTLTGNGGLSTRACQSDGSFSGVSPTCTPVDCGAPPAIANGTVSGATTYGSIDTYSCNGGYMLVGTASTTCTANGTWSGATPSCVPIPMPCSPNPCQNGGTCNDLGSGNYSCNCQAGYGGTNCGTPVTCSGATAPTNGSVNPASATYTQSITYACNSGYNLVGSPTRTCQSDGTFSGSAPTCAPVTCTGLVAPSNGSVSATSATYNNSVSYACSAGYTLVGNSSRTCQADGTFSGADPSCAPVDCGVLSNPTNGAVSAPTTTFGSTATYSCNAGYALNGSPTRSCQSTALWSGAAPTCTLIMTGCMPNPCQNGGVCSPMGGSGFTCACGTGWTGTDCSTPVTCSGAAAPANGAVSSSTATYNTSVTYSCNSGYSLVGSATQLCQANGTFAGTAPTCAPVTCSGASAPTNGTVTATSTTYPNSITYACNSGYTLTGNGGSATRSCQADTTFSGTAPTCAPVTCSGATAPTNGSVSATSATFGNTITYTCNAGYTLTGSATSTCQANATFSPAAPTCVPVSCPALTNPANGSVTAPSLTFGSTASYSCNAGFTLTGSATTSCQANMTWSNPAPTCTVTVNPCSPNPCMNGGTCTPAGASYTCACQPGYSGANCGTPATCAGATNPTNGTVSAMSTTYPNSITYTCNAGYMIGSGSAMRTCQSDGTFSGTAATCVAVTCSGAVAPMNGTVSSSSTTYPNSITYTCNAGYTLTGSASQSCQANGTFAGSAPTCTPVNCGAPAAPTNGTVSAPTTTFGSTATYACNSMYAIQGTATATCQAGGTWSAAPTCVYDCGALTAPTNGGVSTAPNTLVGATATYTCNAGYTLTGSATRTCAAGGWGGAAPTCTMAVPTFCDVTYATGNGANKYGTFHLFNNSVVTVNLSPTVGTNTLLPRYGNTPNFTNMNTPFTTAAYPRGWVRVRYPANAAGTAPVAGAMGVVEFYAPIDVSGLGIALGLTVNIAVDGGAGVMQTTSTGCPGGAARCVYQDATMTPVIQRPCTTRATGVVAIGATTSTITWDACSIAAPAGWPNTTGTPSAAQLNFPPTSSVAMAAPADPGCMRDMAVWGGIACTAGGLAGCGAAGSLTTSPMNSVWDQKLAAVTLNGTNIATATATIPEFIVPETDGNTYTGARVTAAPVIAIECGQAAAITCNEN